MISPEAMDNQNKGLRGSDNAHFFDLLQPSSSVNSKKKIEEIDFDIVPSYDFQPIHPKVAEDITHITTPKSMYSSEGYSSGEHTEPAKTRQENNRAPYDLVTVEAVEHIMKQYTGNLLHALEGVSGRLSHLESTTRHLETSLGDLKMTVENNHGATDGKLRLLENHIREVQTGVQILRDKQEIAEAHSQLMKLQLSKSNSSISQAKPMDTPQNVVSTTSYPPAAPAPNPPEQMFSVSSSLPPQQTISPIQTSPSTGSQYPHPSTQILPNEPSFQLPVQQSAVASHPYQAPPNFQQVPPPSLPSLPYSQQSQPLHSSSQPVPPHVPPPYGQSERSPQVSVHSVPHSQGTPLPSNRYGQEPSYMPTNYGGPNPHQQLPQASPPPQSSQHFSGGQQMYEPSMARTVSGRSLAPMSYGPSPPGLNNNDPQSYNGPIYRVPQPVPSAPSGGSGYSQLPTAQPVQHSLPVATSVRGSSSASSAAGNKVAVDEIIDKVSAMGFSRGQVTSTIQRLRENGQQIDLNVVLDKLMNDGAIQPEEGWFAR